MQIGLLTEHELTKLIELVIKIRGRLDLDPKPTPELEDFQKDVTPKFVLDAIEGHQNAE